MDSRAGLGSLRALLRARHLRRGGLEFTVVNQILLSIDTSDASVTANRLAIAFAQCQGAQVQGLMGIDPYLFAGVGQASTLGHQTHDPSWALIGTLA